MKAAVYYGPGDIRLEERPVPKPSRGEVRLRVEACAICGTDVRIFTQGQKNVVPPQVTGHEICGLVDAIGEGAEGYKVGEKVIVVTPVGCMKCRACQRGRQNLCESFRAIGYHFNGGFTQFMVMPEEAVSQGCLIRVPRELPAEEACLIEPLSCCVNGQEYLDIQVGDRVVIYGAGPIGLMHMELARASGATHVTIVDIAADRLKKADEVFAIDRVIDSTAEDAEAVILSESGGRGPDAIICAAPAHAVFEQALRICATFGRISYFASLSKKNPVINFDANLLHYKEIGLFGAFASYAAQYQRAADLVAARKVDMRKFITHRFPLEDIHEAFEVAKSGAGFKVVVTPHGGGA